MAVIGGLYWDGQTEYFYARSKQENKAAFFPRLLLALIMFLFIELLLRPLFMEEDIACRGNIGVMGFIGIMQKLGLSNKQDNPKSANRKPGESRGAAYQLLRKAVGDSEKIPYETWIDRAEQAAIARGYRTYVPGGVSSGYGVGPDGKRKIGTNIDEEERMRNMIAREGTQGSTKASLKSSSKKTSTHGGRKQSGDMSLRAEGGAADVVVPSRSGSKTSFLKNERDHFSFCRKLVTDCVTEAIETGQARINGRGKQVSFSERMVVQSFFSTEQLFSFFFPAPNFRSLSLCSNLRRALIIDHGCLLRQVDLLTGGQMEPIHLGLAPPFLPSKAIGMAIDDPTSTLAVLDSTWKLQAWDMRFKHDGPTATRELTRFAEVKQARILFEHRGYGEIAPYTLMASCDIPTRGFLLNVSFVNGVIMLFEVSSLGLLHKINVGGVSIDSGIGLGSPSLWERCETADYDYSGKCDKSVFLNATEELALSEDSKVALLNSSTGNDDKIEYRSVLRQLDSHRYRLLSAPKVKQARQRLDKTLTHTMLKAMRLTGVRDMLFELQVIESTALMMGTCSDDTIIYFIDFTNGRLLGQVKHSGIKAARPDTNHLPPTLLYVESADCLLSAGRNEWDGCINMWNLGDVSNGKIPTSPCKRLHWDCPLSPTATIAYLPVSQCILQCRVDGGICIWDPVTPSYQLNEPSKGEHDERVGGGAKTLKYQQTTYNCSSTKPALVINEGSQGEAFPTVFTATARRAQGIVDVFTTITAPQISTGARAEQSASGTISGYTVLRTRVRVPAVASDLQSLESLVRQKKNLASAHHLSKGMSQMKDAQLAQIQSLLRIEGPRRANHERRGEVAMRKACLEFEWDPCEENMDPNGEQTHLMGMKSKSTKAEHGGRQEEDVLLALDVDDMTISGKAQGVWKHASHHSHNFTHKWASQRYKWAWMGHCESVKSEDKGTHINDIKAGAQLHMMNNTHEMCRTHTAAVTHVPVVDIKSQDADLFDLSVNNDSNKFKWVEHADGTWKRVETSANEQVKVLTDQRQKVKVTKKGDLPFKWQGQTLVKKFLTELRRQKLTKTRGCTAIMPLKPQTNAQVNQAVSWAEVPLTVTDLFQAMANAFVAQPHTLTAESFVKPIFRKPKNPDHEKNVDGAFSDTSCDETDQPNFSKSGKMKRAGANAPIRDAQGVPSSPERRKAGLSIAKTVQGLVDVVRNVPGDDMPNHRNCLVRIGCKAAQPVCDSFIYFCKESLIYKLQMCGNLSKFAIRDAVSGVAGGILVETLLRTGNSWNGRMSALELEWWLGSCGVIVHNSNRESLDDSVFEAISKDKESDAKFYNVAQVMRSIFGPDKCFEGIEIAPLRRAITAADPDASGWVKSSILEGHIPMARRVAQRLAAVSCHTSPEPKTDELLYGSLLEGLVDTIDEVLHFFVEKVTQTHLVYLLSPFLGGLKVQEDKKSYGWSGNFPNASGIFARDALLTTDLEVALRSVCGVGASETAVRMVSTHFDRHQRGAVSATEILKHIFNARTNTLEAVLCSIAKQESPARIAGVLADAEAVLSATSDVKDSEITEHKFVMHMYWHFPQLRYVPWAQLAKQFAADLPKNTDSIEPLEPSATATTLRATGSTQPPVPSASNTLKSASLADIAKSGLEVTDINLADAEPEPATTFQFPLTSPDAQQVLASISKTGKVKWRKFVTSLERVAYGVRNANAGAHDLPNAQFQMKRESSAQNLSISSIVQPDGEVRKVPGREVFLMLHGIRASLRKVCEGADQNSFGTVKREEMHGLLTNAGARLHDSELEALVDFADMRGDGLIPYRSFIRRVEVMLGNRPPGQGGIKSLPPMHTEDDFWVQLYRVIQDRCPDMPMREVFGGAAMFGDIVTHQVFFTSLHKLGMVIETRDPYHEREKSMNESHLVPRPTSEYALRAAQSLAEEAFSRMDRDLTGACSLRDIKRNLDRVSERTPPELQAFIPDYLRGKCSDELLETIALIANDFLSEDLCSFEAFAYLDSSRNGVITELDFCCNMGSAVPILPFKKAQVLYRFIKGLWVPEAGSSRLGITLGQFSHVFPLQAQSTLVTKKMWLESIVNRMVKAFHARGWSLEAAFRNMDQDRGEVYGAGVLTLQKLQDAANRLQCGVSPQELTVLFQTMNNVDKNLTTVDKDRVTYRAFVRILQPGYANLQTKFDNKEVKESVGKKENIQDTVKTLVSSKCYQVRSPLAVFRKFASGVRLAKGELHTLLTFLGVNFTHQQKVAFWKLVDPYNSGVVTEKQWTKVLDRGKSAADSHWGSVFSRLEIGCTTKGVTLKQMLDDLDVNEDGFLSVVEAQRVFTKIGVAVNARDIDDWIQLVTTEPGKIDINRACAVTLHKAYAGPSFAALRLHSALYQASITGAHALDVILAGKGVSSVNGNAGMLRGVMLTREDIVNALHALNLELSPTDITTLLDFMDPMQQDAIQAARFLRVAQPDPAAERNRLKQMGVELPDGPVSGELLNKSKKGILSLL